LLELVSTHQISEEIGDKAKEQFDVLLTDKSFLEPVSNFKCSEDRLDHFYATHLNERTDIWMLCGVLFEKFLYTYFHMETPMVRVGSLSTRTCLMVQNLEERSLIAQRLVYDTIKIHDGPLKVPVPITKEVEKCAICSPTLSNRT